MFDEATVPTAAPRDRQIRVFISSTFRDIDVSHLGMLCAVSCSACRDPIKSDARIYELLKKGFYGRRWLFEAVEKWRQAANHDSRLFWIMGAPGVGKSAFATQLTHTRGDTVIAAQFREWDKPDHHNAPRVVRSLAPRLIDSSFPVWGGYRAVGVFDNLVPADLTQVTNNTWTEGSQSGPLDRKADYATERGKVDRRKTAP